MSDWYEDRLALNEAEKDERAQAVEDFRRQVRGDLERDGFVVREIEPWHYRVNGRLDLYPVRQRYHWIGRPQQRGYYRDAVAICRQFFREHNAPGTRPS